MTIQAGHSRSAHIVKVGPRRQRPGALHTLTLCVIACGISLAGLCTTTAQTQTNISQAAAKTCAVMSGQRMADGQTLQYLMLLQEDLADPNPVALALYKEVLRQCPKAYLNYQQRKKVNNPFPPGSLVKETPTELTKSGSSLTNPSTSPEYPLRCHGGHGMASADGKTLTVEFKKGDRPADQALQLGQCSWPDRGMRPNEPARIVDERLSIAEAKNTAAHINAGNIWTFWVVNTGTVFKATAIAKGIQSQKP